jgi:hypothetical protein
MEFKDETAAPGRKPTRKTFENKVQKICPVLTDTDVYIRTK